MKISFTRGRNYVLVLKGNQGEFHEDIKLFLDTHLQYEFTTIEHDVFSHINGDHGRIETRKVWLISDVEWLNLGDRWEEKTYERRYYITNHNDKSAKFIAQIIRGYRYV